MTIFEIGEKFARLEARVARLEKIVLGDRHLIQRVALVSTLFLAAVLMAVYHRTAALETASLIVSFIKAVRM